MEARHPARRSRCALRRAAVGNRGGFAAMDGTAAARRVVALDRDARLAGNAAALAVEMAWLACVIDVGMQALAAGAAAAVRLPEPPPASPDDSPFGDLVERLRLEAGERIILALALAPHVRPQTLDPLFASTPESGRGRTEAGGIQGRSHGGVIPTAATALLLMGGAPHPPALRPERAVGPPPPPPPGRGRPRGPGP